jgi:hypothetical protein
LIDKGAMKIVSTSDIPLEALREWATELNPEFEAAVDQGQVHLRSIEAPSWVTLLAEASWWTKLLAAYTALYVAEIVKEAAKDTWRNRAKALSAAKIAGNRLRDLADAFADLRRRVGAPTTLGIGLPVPNEFFSTQLTLEGTDSDELLPQLALFIHHLPALSRFISEHGLTDGRVATGVFLRLRDDGDLLISWHDRRSLEIHEHVLDVGDAV